MEDGKYSLPKVAVRMVREPPLYSNERIQSPGDAVQVLAEAFRDLDREVLCVVNLQTDLKPININVVSVGVLDAAPAHPREILKTSILSNASCVMLVHTHPSGNLTPSQQDVALTDRMQRVYTELGIPLVDHIILGRNGQYYSFRNKEIMPAYRPIYETDIDSFEIMSVAEQRESIRGQIREAEREIRSTEQKESSRPVYNRHVKRAAHER